jgi:DNA-binding NarL/FixJ family response regulator
MIRVLLADDHAMVRTGLEQLLGSISDMQVVGIATNGRDAVRLAVAVSPDVILMDLSMPIVDGIEATRQIKASMPNIAIIALTTFQDPRQVSAALSAGASGYLVKDIEPEVLVAGIRSVVKGGAPLSPSVAAQLLRQGGAQLAPTASSLTPRESEILRLIAQGHTNKQIARQLGISEKTVKTHCSRLFQRIGVVDRTQAAVWATRNLPIDETNPA